MTHYYPYNNLSATSCDPPCEEEQVPEGSQLIGLVTENFRREECIVVQALCIMNIIISFVVRTPKWSVCLGYISGFMVCEQPLTIIIIIIIIVIIIIIIIIAVLNTPHE